MAWYWWVLIAVGCVAIYILKVACLKRIQKNSKMKKEQRERELEDD